MDEPDKPASHRARQPLAAAKTVLTEIVRSALGTGKPPYGDEDWQQFRNILGGLRYVKQSDLVEAGIIPDTECAWRVFQRQPTDFFLILPDHLASSLFELAKAAA